MVDEFVASRRVGEATVTVISEGAMLWAPRFEITEDERHRAMPEAAADGKIVLGLNLVHLRVPGASILVDPGCDDPTSSWQPRFAARFPGLQRSPGLRAGLARVGARPEAITQPSVFLDRDAWVHVWDKAEREEHARRGRVDVPAGTGVVTVNFVEPADFPGGVRVYLWPSWPAEPSVRVRWEGSGCAGFDVEFGAASAFADRLDADRAREDARKIRLQQGRAAGPYAVTGGSAPRIRERRGGVRPAAQADQRDNERA